MAWKVHLILSDPGWKEGSLSGFRKSMNGRPEATGVSVEMSFKGRSGNGSAGAGVASAEGIYGVRVGLI